MNKLSDFPNEVLSAMLGAVIFTSEHIKTHIKDIEAYGPDVRKLMAKELIDLNKEIGTLETAEIQIATAIAENAQRERILMN